MTLLLFQKVTYLVVRLLPLRLPMLGGGGYMSFHLDPAGLYLSLLLLVFDRRDAV
jgi:hypothetical protein